MKRTLTLSAAALICSAGAAAAASNPIATGEDYFFGGTSFSKGGPACASCHTIAGAGALGGGALGPDLTARPYVPPAVGLDKLSPTMAPIFGEGSDQQLTPDEVAALTAFLGKAAKPAENEKAAAPADDTRYRLIGFGVAGVVGFFLLAGVVWGGRLRSVRGRLVKSSKLKRTSRKR